MPLIRKKLRDSKTVPLPREIVLPLDDYQPTKAELEEEFEPPGASMEENLRMIFRPVRVVRRVSKERK